MSHNEADTRSKLIDPAIHDRGWTEDHIKREESAGTIEIVAGKAKRKLLEENNLWCILSLPGGVFTAAGAGVKTNLLFFKKGEHTEKIWYYDLSDIKVGKKSPMTLDKFEEFFRLLPTRGDSEQSWTVDMVARKQKATEEDKRTPEQLLDFI